MVDGDVTHVVALWDSTAWCKAADRDDAFASEGLLKLPGHLMPRDIGDELHVRMLSETQLMIEI